MQLLANFYIMKTSCEFLPGPDTGGRSTGRNTQVFIYTVFSNFTIERNFAKACNYDIGNSTQFLKIPMPILLVSCLCPCTVRVHFHVSVPVCVTRESNGNQKLASVNTSRLSKKERMVICLVSVARQLQRPIKWQRES